MATTVTKPSENRRGGMTRREILATIPVYETTLWRWIRAKKFPGPVNPNGGRLIWRRSDVERWLGEEV